MTTSYVGQHPVVDPAQIIAGNVRLNDNWQLRYATVTDIRSISQATGRYDGDVSDNTIPLISLAGPLGVGWRVAVIFIPPSGNYVFSVISTVGGASEYVDYFPTLSSSGVQPNVGTDGFLLGRWKLSGHRTVTVEVTTEWGTPGAGQTQGTGRYFWSSPFQVTDRSRRAATGACYMFDSGVANRAGIVNVTSGLDSYFVTNTPNGDVGAGVPNAWTTGDAIAFSITHEVSSFF